MQRISVVGNSGSGKSTFAKQLSALLNIPHIELDSVFHQPNWTQLENEEFRARVTTATNDECWVTCGNYRHVIDIVWSRADTIVVIDFPRRIVMWRITKRTILRSLKREELWNGNREPFLNFIALHNPEKSVIAWAWTRHRHYHNTYRAAAEVSDNGATWLFFTKPREVRQFLDNCSGRA